MSTASLDDHALLIEKDRQARLDALDVARSFLVQAPAGSGKTELLTQRLLALLSVVDEPEEVLAITFTKAATAEMLNRVMGALREAKTLLENGERPEKKMHAIAALERSQSRGWSLLEQPQRLNIQTIDSLCLRIAYEAPLLSRLGGQLQPTEDVEPLFALAARRTIERLGESGTPLSAALERLLRLRDVSLGECERLIADMLGNRDQWLEEFSSARSLTEEQWAALRARREEPIRREHERSLHAVRTILHAHPDEVGRMLKLFAHVCEDGEPPREFHALKEMTHARELQELAHFICVRSFLLTKEGEWRQNTHRTIGFRGLKEGGSRERIAEFKALVSDVSRIDGLREALCKLSNIPDKEFSDDEWETIRSIFTVLLHAAAELRVVFAERSLIDFVEAGITADHALRDPEVRRRWSDKIRHLLVDEFQDTSRKQYKLLQDIVRDWDAHEIETGGRTCFLVGDPMQSIYLFRYADLALFDEVKRHGFGADVSPLRFTHLTLGRNFRSTAGIVEPINAMFDAAVHSGAPGAARFRPAVADAGSAAERAVHFHPELVVDDADKPAALAAEAELAVELIRGHMPALEQAKSEGRQFRIGVLVRTKKDVTRIAAALREAAIPFRAVEIETLHQRQEVRDLLSLMHALIHPMDRIAWLAVLRAPWCGLSLADLHMLSGNDEPLLQRKAIRELLKSRVHLLSEDGQQRAERVRQTLEAALNARFSGEFSASPHGFASWIEEAWTELGGPLCIDANAAENVQAFFRLLAEFAPSGIEASGLPLEQRLKKLFAQPDPRAPEKCSVQLMTIHKAKGLGFDVVLVPGLHQKGRGIDSPLLRWMARTRPDTGERELLMAPIGIKGRKGSGASSATYDWIGALQKRDERAELHRLLYVAATRARRDLHLFATLKRTHAGGIAAPDARSLLKCGWAYLEQFAMPAEQGLHLVPHLREPMGLDLAASAASYTQNLKRLPADWARTTASAAQPEHQPATEDTPRNRIGSLASRTRGLVLHALFESLSSLPEDDPRRAVTSSLDHWNTVATAMLRHAGLGKRELETELKAVLDMLKNAARDPDAQWILGQRPYAQSESAWTVEEEGELKIVRCDRVFLGGAEPQIEGEYFLWIVDYKTADEGNAGTFLMEERARYEPQLLRYAEALREADVLHERKRQLRLALYYPALPRLLWWPA
jgi:ATP-dependent exoDNAse (exonuclease V) beta subunit